MGKQRGGKGKEEGMVVREKGSIARTLVVICGMLRGCQDQIFKSLTYHFKKLELY